MHYTFFFFGSKLFLLRNALIDYILQLFYVLN